MCKMQKTGLGDLDLSLIVKVEKVSVLSFWIRTPYFYLDVNEMWVR